MKNRTFEMVVGTVAFAQKGSSGNLYASTYVPTPIRSMMDLTNSASRMRFQYLESQGSSLHLMKDFQGDRPNWTNPFVLRRTGQVTLPASFITPDSCADRSEKVAFIANAETAVIARLDMVVGRLGHAAMELGDEHAMGQLLMTQYSNYKSGELTITSGPAAGMPLMPHLVGQAFPELSRI